MNIFDIRALGLVVAFTFGALTISNAQVPGQLLKAELTALKPANLLPANVAASIKFEDRSGAAKPATLTQVEAPGGASVARIENFVRSENASSVEAVALTEKPIKKGDICLARFAVRALYARQESGEAIFNCYFQQSSAPYEKSFSMQLGAGPDWKTYEIPFEAKVDSDAGASALCFAFALLPQQVEIASVEVLDFEHNTALDQLPATRFSYAGREEGAAWRSQALARIEQIRTAPLDIVVTDNVGNPVPDASVQMRLVQPAFNFGSAVSASLLASTASESQIYRDKVAELFDTVTIDNDMKWNQWLGAKRQEGVLQAMSWIESKGLRLRGHNLVWPGMKFSPKRLQTLANPSVGIPQQIETHIEDEVSATKGRIWAWDVLNEPVHERDFYGFFPDTVSADWFKQTRKLDPQALLFVNEYGMLNGRGSPDFIKRYLAFIKMLQDNGAPLDGIGVQGHIGTQVRNPVDVLSDLDMLQTSGLPINITEFDINTKDEQLQADYTRDFLIAIYSHPGVTGFIQWGFWQGAHWKPDAAMFRADWSEKPSAQVYRDWVLGKWRTKVDATTDTRGKVDTRGHLGKYEVTVSKGNTSVKYNVLLTKERGTVRLTLQPT